MARGTPDHGVWERGLREFDILQADLGITHYHIRAVLGDAVQAIFTAPEVPALGWRTFSVRAKESTAAPAALNPLMRAILPLASRFVSDTSMGRALLARLQRNPASQPPCRIENEFFSVEVGPDGTLTILDKAHSLVYAGMNRFVDGGDCGDEYNYAPPEMDTPFPQARLVDASVQRGLVTQTLTIKLELSLPPRLNRNRKARVNQRKFFVSMPVTCQVILAAGVARVDVRTSLENRAQDHRLRVHFPTPFDVDSAEHDGHFEIVRRRVGAPPFERTDWIEDPRPEVPQRAFSDVTDGQAGLMLANRGLPEVEVLKTPGGSEIALTLLRCVGWLSRDDFATRRGHAGPEEATPGAQMTGNWTFDYSIIPHGSERPHALAYGFETPLRAVTTGAHPGNLPERGSFVAVEQEGNGTAFVVSAVKQAESRQGWILRGYNAGAEALEVGLTPWRRFSTVTQVNLAEMKQASLPVDTATGAVKLQVRGHEIVTVLFEEE